jgi:hypothetical protein
VDGQEGPEYDKVWGPVFGPDGERVAYAADRGSKKLVVVDGTETAEYDRLEWLAFEGPTRLRAVAVRNDEIFRLEIEIGEG